ncbi:undecaprenyl-diphosphatase [Tistlia consotensis]|uniref:Undecaprenyl-diphosphatase n=1 Tax=Tistlia consotensis USBA 355 TaxID=560819 RepID=A0A1Y6BPW1_9PROT|nr:phosphatase PAP2 family protein [Tistlia consotensis]SMF14431.1 undecaprenyl-diphosphatase [Tistlia consotensis USBA 355]SNR49546.1 undecaprenyl-diphosphatase [Tistlia consotensis]
MPQPSTSDHHDDLLLHRSLRFWALLALVVLLGVFVVDRPLSQLLRQAGEPLLDLFRFLTGFGKSDAYLWGSALVTIGAAAAALSATARPRKRLASWLAGYAFFFFWAVAGSGIVANILKVIFGRARPKLLDQQHIYGFSPFGFGPDLHSFPSGHTTTGFAIAVAVTLFAPGARFWCLGFALVIAASRVIVNAHFLSDVAGGAAVGTLFTLLLARFFRDRGWLFRHVRWGTRLKAEGRWWRLALRRRLRPFLLPVSDALRGPGQGARP